MSDIKWFKVLTDMFGDDKIKIIQSMPEGDALLVMWFKVLAQAGKTNDGGYIYLKKNIPYSPAMLSTLFGKHQQLVELALRTFAEFGMIDLDERGYIFVTNWEKHQNIEGMDKVREQTRIRNVKYREKKRLELQEGDVNHDVTVTVNDETELELELDKDINNKKISGRKRPTRTQFIIPSIEEVILYCNERNNGVDPYRWHDHYTANDWKVGKNPMKDWKAAVRTWERGKSSSSTSTVARTGQAAYHIPTIEELKEQDKKRMEQIKAEGMDWL